MERRHRIGFGWILASAFFLWNPVIAMVDLPPDLIGYLLLYAGISRFADLGGELGEGQARWRKVLWLSFGKAAAEYLLYFVMDRQAEEMNRYELPVWILIFSFAVIVLEWYYLIPAYRSLFTGLSDLTLKYGALPEQEEKFTRLSRLSVRFVILRGLLSVIPELTVLTSFETDAGNPVFSFDWYAYIDLFRGIATALALIPAVIWLVSWITAFRRAQDDREWRDRMAEAYETGYAQHPERPIGNRVKGGAVLFRIGSLFFISLGFGGYEHVPAFLSVLFFAVGAWLLGEWFRFGKFGWAAAGTLFAVGMGDRIALWIYLAKFLPEDADYYEAAFRGMMIVIVFSVVKTVLACAVLVLLLLALYRLICDHTSVNYGEQDGELSQKATERRHREFLLKLILTSIFAGISTVAKICGILLFLLSDWFWWIPTVLSVVTVCLFSSYLNDVSEELVSADANLCKRNV